MNGLILLDEDQQRSLFTDSQRSSRPDSLQTHPPVHAGNYNYRVGGGGAGRPDPRTNFTSNNNAEPRTDFTQHNRASPRANFATARTDFTSHTNAEPRTDFTSRPIPRTDFTSNQGARVDFTTRTGPPRTDFTANQGPQRTDFTINRSSRGDSVGKPSNETHRTSLTATATVDFTTGERGGIVMEELGGDSYPILRDDLIRDSSTGSTSHAPDQYAGTSSGLKISVRWIMAGLLFGIGLGILLSELKVESVIAQWVSLPGDLFIRALKCLVVPYVFCSVAVAVGDIVFVGKVSVIGWQTAKIFAMFWLATVTMGITVAMIFRPLFRAVGEQSGHSLNEMGFTCSDGLLLTTIANGSVACVTNASTFAAPTTFTVLDVNSVYSTASSQVASLTLSQQLLQMITPIVSDNILASMANTKLLSIITFSMLLGSVAGRNFFTKTRHVNYLYLLLLQLRNTLFLMMEWTIWLSPVAVVSIIAGSFATNQDYRETIGKVYTCLLAAILAAALQMLIIYPLLVFLMTRCNPYAHMRQMVRAYFFAFASASSLATMPVTLSCVKKARMCSQSVGNFVISIGVVSGISGMGWYLPIALTFLAEASGNGNQLTVLRVFGMFVLSLLACAGTPPIPSSSLVVISTAYTTLFGALPATTFAYVVAMDFVIDRISTTCNVNDDVMALKIISETTDETVAQDHLGERF